MATPRPRTICYHVNEIRTYFDITMILYSVCDCTAEEVEKKVVEYMKSDLDRFGVEITGTTFLDVKIIDNGLEIHYEKFLSENSERVYDVCKTLEQYMPYRCMKFIDFDGEYIYLGRSEEDPER